MKKNILFIFLFVSFSLKAQYTNFDKGYLEGYKKGYCYSSNANSSWYCNPPVFIPSAPFPKYPEKSESYNDGYNRGFDDGRGKRDAEDKKTDNTTSSSGTLKFNPYVPQNPIVLMSPEERAMYYAAKAAREQAQAVALGNLLNAIFTPRILSPEEILKRDLRRLKEEQEALKRKNERLLKIEARRLVEGSIKYVNCKKSKTKWLSLAGLTLAGGAITYLQANQLSEKYKTATIDAEKLKRNGNLLYQVAPICFAITGISIIEFGIKNSKIKNAKPKL
jgi:hypothetical protein